MMASKGMGVWILEKRTAAGWEFCNVYSKPEDGQKEAPDYRPVTSPIHWDNQSFSSLGFIGDATVPAFKLSLRMVS